MQLNASNVPLRSNLPSKVADATITLLIKMPVILVRFFFFFFLLNSSLYRFVEQKKLHQQIKSIFACSPAQLCQLEEFLFPHILAEKHYLK